MKLLRILEQPKERYTLLFFGYAVESQSAESQSAVIELTYNYGESEYDIGNGFGHIAIGVEDIKKTIRLIKSLGHPIDLAPKKLKGSHETIAFITDPDGYKIELIERTSHVG